MKISKSIQKLYPNIQMKTVQEKEVKSLGLINSPEADIASFANEKKYLKNLPPNIKMLLIVPKLEAAAAALPETGYVVVDNPKEVFWKLHNSLEGDSAYVREKRKNRVSETANVSPFAQISPYNVVIGEHVTIEAFATVYENTVIEENCTLRSGCRIGGVGFAENKSGRYIETVMHYGGVILHKGVEIQCNTCIDRGIFPWENTEIGAFTKIDNLVHIAHSVKTGEACLIAANAAVAGFCRIGNEVWVGLGSAIRNRVIIGDHARINMGSVVVENVKEGTDVSGNYAMDHSEFLYYQMKLRKFGGGIG